jgi:hypothetical protein
VAHASAARSIDIRGASGHDWDIAQGMLAMAGHDLRQPCRSSPARTVHWRQPCTAQSSDKNCTGLRSQRLLTPPRNWPNKGETEAYEHHPEFRDELMASAQKLHLV